MEVSSAGVVGWDGLGVSGLCPWLVGWHGVELVWEPGNTGWRMDTLGEGPVGQGCRGCWPTLGWRGVVGKVGWEGGNWLGMGVC